MIKANELRLGNYFKLGVKYVDLKSFTRTDIYPIETTIYVGYNDRLKNHPIAFGELEPIPLTEEILLKCGFVTRYPNVNDKYFEFEEFIINSFSRGKAFKLNINCAIYTDLEIKHLHQLQNLYFALTNKELEIKL